MKTTIEPICLEIDVNARIERLWQVLTDPLLIADWMTDDGTKVEVLTNWQPGSSIVIKGFYHYRFENKGMVMRYEPNHFLQYSHLSSFSNLPDEAENYTLMSFALTNENGNTRLNITIENFPTLSIYQHLLLYWKSTIFIIKDMAECYHNPKNYQS